MLAPPSHVDRKPYRVLAERGTGGSALDWAAVTGLLEPSRSRHITRGRSAGHAGPARLVAWVARLEEGNRNCGLFWAACRAIETAQEHLLADLAAAAATTGLPRHEISRTIASARRAVRSSSQGQHTRDRQSRDELS